MKEYGPNEISKFLNYTISKDIKHNDIIGEFRHVENDMRESINKAIKQFKSTAQELFNYISNSDKIMDIRSLAKLWGEANQNVYMLNNLLKRYDELIKEINQDISEFFREGD